MGIKLNKISGTWRAFVCKRHPITKKPTTKTKDGLKSKAEALRAEKKLRDELAVRLDREKRVVKEPAWSNFLLNYYEELDRREIST